MLDLSISSPPNSSSSAKTKTPASPPKPKQRLQLLQSQPSRAPTLLPEVQGGILKGTAASIATPQPATTRPVSSSAVRRYVSPTGSSTFNITQRAWIHNTAFFRDGAGLWDGLIANRALFAAARSTLRQNDTSASSAARLRVWSCGCSSGEELFTARMVYQKWVAPSFGEHAPEFVGYGTDRDATIVKTVQDLRYEWSEAALANVPIELRDAFFHEVAMNPEWAPTIPKSCAKPFMAGRRYQPMPNSCISPSTADPGSIDGGLLPKRFTLSDGGRASCSFGVEDTTAVAEHVCRGAGAAPSQFDLVLCRYSIFLYSNGADASVALGKIVQRLAPGGILVLGMTDPLPQGSKEQHGLEPFGDARLNAWRRTSAASDDAAFTADAADEHKARLPGGTTFSNALAHASCLQEFRASLGLPERFVAEAVAAPAGPAPALSARSAEILQTSPCSHRAAGAPVLERLQEEANAFEKRRLELEKVTLAEYAARWSKQMLTGKAKAKRNRKSIKSRDANLHSILRGK